MTTLLRAGRLATDGETAACAGIRKPCIAPSAATPPRNARRRMLISLAMLSSPWLRRGSPFPSPQQTQAYRLIFRSRQRKIMPPGGKKISPPRRSFACAGVLLPRSVWRGDTELEYMQAIGHDASWLQLRGV